MNRLNVVLAAATLLLAGLAFHYARAVKLQRAQNAQAQSGADAQAPIAQRGREGGALAAGPESTASAGSTPGTNGSNRFEPGNLAIARHRLQVLQTPQGHAQRLQEIVDALGDGNWRTVATRIGLSTQEADSFLQARAERLIRRQQQRLQCQIDPTCDIRVLGDSLSAANKRDEEELLGPERFARKQAYQASADESNQVERLSKRLPTGGALPRTEVEKLVRVLADERRKIAAEIEQYGLKFGAFNSGGLELASAATADAADEYLQRRESATRYSQRLYNRAARELSGAQLAEFKVLHDELLADYLELLRENEIRRVADEAAGK